MRAIVLSGLLLCLPSFGANAYFDTGNDLFGRCNKSEHWSTICTASASSYMDMMQALGFKCNDKGVNRQQLKDVMLKYLADTPDERHLPAAFIAILSFEKAFACKKAQ